MDRSGLRAERGVSCVSRPRIKVSSRVGCAVQENVRALFAHFKTVLGGSHFKLLVDCNSEKHSEDFLPFLSAMALVGWL